METETKTKTFRSAFGDKYTLDVLAESEIRSRIDDLDENEMLEKLIRGHGAHDYSYAYMSIETGEVEYYHMIGNNDLQQQAHLILLETLSGSQEEGLSVEDFLDPDEIAKIDYDQAWEVIRELDDYEDRLVQAHQSYYEGINKDRVDERILEVYQYLWD